MGATQLTSDEIGSVKRNDFDTTTTTQAVITKVVASAGMSLSSTGVDAGTGDVTLIPIVTIGADKTSNYTLVLTDVNTDVQMNVASANTCTIPNNTNVAIPIGSQGLITQKGAGATTIVADTSVTFNTSNLTLLTQGAKIAWEKTGTNSFYLIGEFAAATDNMIWKTAMEATASHIAAKVAGTYGLGMGDPAAVSGTGTLYPLNVFNVASTDFGVLAKMRINAQIYVNDVAPTGNFTFGLYPITRPGTSGGAGLNIYTLGTVVSGSTVLFTTPAADSSNTGNSADFSVPSDGPYVIGVVTTATVATSSHLHMVAKLQVK